VRFAYEWYDDNGYCFRSHGNENWEVDEHGPMPLRIASISDASIKESELQNDWPLGRRPDAFR
jgi:nuclear transport factor 2 (NTF2) superfamily protein